MEYPVSPDRPGKLPRRWSRLVLGFVLGGLALNGAWLLTHPPGPLSGETPHWWPIALNLAGGKGYVGCFPEYFPSCRNVPPWPTAAREPLPVLLFAAVAAASGNSLLAASVVEVLLDVLVLVALLLLTREFADETTALVAGLLWLLYLPALKLIPQVSGELLTALGLVSALHFFLRARRTGRMLFYLASGLALGVAALSRSSSLVVAPVLAGIAMLRPPLAGPRRAGLAALLLGLAIPMAPWVARNLAVFGEPVFGSTLVGYNLYRENEQLASGDYLRFVAGAEAGRAVERLLKEKPAFRQARNEEEMEELYREKAVEVIRDHPARYLVLTGYRFFLLWFDWGYLEAYGKHPRVADYLLMIEQAVLLLLAVVGLWNARPGGLPLGASVVAVSLAYMAVISQLRFIVPVMPLTMALSAAGLLTVGGVLKRRLRAGDA